MKKKVRHLLLIYVYDCGERDAMSLLIEFSPHGSLRSFIWVTASPYGSE